MKIAICDDQLEDIAMVKHELERMKKKLHCEMDFLELTDSRTMVKDIMNAGADVVLLDIDMPQVSGLDIANQLSEKFPLLSIIFLTNRADLVFQAIRYRPLRFVRKNCMQVELEEAMQAAMKKIAAELHIIQFQGENASSSYAIKDIVFIESNKHYIEIHMKDGVYRVRGKISDYEKKLGAYGFIRIHMGYLVNVRYIKMLTTKSILMDTGEELPVGRKYAKEIQIKYTEGLKRFVHGCNI